MPTLGAVAVKRSASLARFSGRVAFDRHDNQLASFDDAVEFGRYLGSFIECGLAGPTSDPDLKLSYEFIIRESARLPRVRPPHRAGSSRERGLQ